MTLGALHSTCAKKRKSKGCSRVFNGSIIASDFICVLNNHLPRMRLFHLGVLWCCLVLEWDTRHGAWRATFREYASCYLQRFAVVRTSWYAHSAPFIATRSALGSSTVLPSPSLWSRVYLVILPRTCTVWRCRFFPDSPRKTAPHISHGVGLFLCAHFLYGRLSCFACDASCCCAFDIACAYPIKSALTFTFSACVSASIAKSPLLFVVSFIMLFDVICYG